jgi:hypothetical protein
MKRHGKRPLTPQMMRQAEQATARLREIHDRYTPEAISERLNRDGYTDLEAAVRAEVERQLADYRQAEEDFDIPGLSDLALRELEGLERLPELIGELLDGNRRLGGIK